jgi:hypothetical protein
LIGSELQLVSAMNGSWSFAAILDDENGRGPGMPPDREPQKRAFA